MLLQEDWLMRQINSMAQAIAKAIFGREEPEYLPDGEFPETDPLHGRLLDLLDQRRINEAENLIFDEIEKEASPRMLKIACDFYSTLAQMEESRLAAADFSREEVAQGIQDIEDLYGISRLESM